MAELQQTSPQTIVESPARCRTGQYYSGQRGFGYMWILGFVCAGLCAVDWTTNSYMQLTLQKFTDNMFWISFLPGTLHRFFGFWVQPLVAWKGDQIQTRWGRRRPFFLFASPGAALALLAVGVMPFIFQGAARYTLFALACVIIANFVLQIFDEICLGCLDALNAETYPQDHLGRVYGVRNYTLLIVNSTLTFVALGLLAAKFEFAPYAFASAFVFLAFLMMLFFVKENYHAPNKRTGFFDLFSSLRLLKDPDYLKLAIIASMGLILPATWSLCSTMFITQTLGCSTQQMSWAIGIAPLLGVLASYPVGAMVDRYGPRAVLAFGFIATAALNAAMVFWVHDFHTLLIVNVINGAVGLFATLPIGPIIFEYADASERGKIFGVIQFFRALSIFTISLILGLLVQNSRSYEPTPFYPVDLKNPTAIAQHVLQPAQPFDHYLRQSIAPATITQLQAITERDTFIDDLLKAIKKNKPAQSAALAEQTLAQVLPPATIQQLRATNDHGKVTGEVVEALRAKTKDAQAIAPHLLPQAGPVDLFLQQTLAPEALGQLQNADRAKLIGTLSPVLNTLMKDPELYTAQRFAGASLSEQSQKLIAEHITSGDRIKVLNRCLIQDMFGSQELSIKHNLRLSYLVVIPVAFLVGLLVLTTRPGKNAPKRD